MNNEETWDLEAFLRSTMRPMAEATFPSIASIVGIVDETEGEYVGSAFRCMLLGKPCLVTAKHVIDEANASPLGAGFTAARGEAPRRLPLTPDLVDEVLDLAVYIISDAAHGEGIAFWPEERIDADVTLRASDFLFVHGFPQKHSRFLFGGIHVKSFPYGVMERDDDLPSDIRPHEFAMDFDPRNMHLPSGGVAADFVDPHGMSGSPVWRIGVSGKSPEAWSPDQSLLMGIVTRWNHEKRVLLATEAPELLELVRRKSSS